MQQRKFRNLEERQRIASEIRDNLMRHLGLDELDELVDVMAAFLAAADTGRSFDGTIEVKHLGLAIEYCLPGRRVRPHYVKIKRSAQTASTA